MIVYNLVMNNEEHAISVRMQNMDELGKIVEL